MHCWICGSTVIRLVKYEFSFKVNVINQYHGNTKQTDRQEVIKSPFFYLVEFHSKSFTDRPQGTTTVRKPSSTLMKRLRNVLLKFTLMLRVTLKRNTANWEDCPTGQLSATGTQKNSSICRWKNVSCMLTVVAYISFRLTG